MVALLLCDFILHLLFFFSDLLLDLIPQEGDTDNIFSDPDPTGQQLSNELGGIEDFDIEEFDMEEFVGKITNACPRWT